MGLQFPQILEEEDFHLSREELKKYDIQTLPENLSVIIDSENSDDNFPLTKLNLLQQELKLEVVKMLLPEDFWNQSYTALQFAEAVKKGIKCLKYNPMHIKNVEYEDNGHDDGVCIWWSMTFSASTSFSDMENAILNQYLFAIMEHSAF